jgi:hypothetical protein
LYPSTSEGESRRTPNTDASPLVVDTFDLVATLGGVLGTP